MELKKQTGLNEPLRKLVDVVSQGFGALSLPYFMQKSFDANEYELNVITESINKNQQRLKQALSKEGKLSTCYMDKEFLQNELPIADRTKKRLDYTELKRQRNLENITHKAALHLELEHSVSADPVSEEWIIRFFNYAQDISSADIQEYWARILAGEVKKPNSFSLRTLVLFSNLSKEETEVFIKFATLAIHSSEESFILNFRNEKILEEEYGLNINDKILLEELGLLTATDHQYTVFKTYDRKEEIIFKVGDMMVVHDKLSNKPEEQMQILIFTKTGQELSYIAKSTASMDYIQLFASKISRTNGTVKYARIINEFPNGQIQHTGLIDVPLLN